jgi:hypothetical protein
MPIRTPSHSSAIIWREPTHWGRSLNLPRYSGTVDMRKTLTRDTGKGGLENTKMTGRQLYRISGLVLVIGAIAFALHVVLDLW